MKRFVIALLGIMLFCLGLSACNRPEPEGEQYEVYYLADHADVQSAALGSQTIRIPEGDEPVDALLAALLTEPAAENLRRSIPEGVLLRGWTLENGVLTVDFSTRYGALSGIELTLADYSVTMTLSQVSEVLSVVTTVESDAISYRDRQNLHPEDVLLALHRSVPTEREVALWLLAETEDGFQAQRQTQTILLAQDESLVMAVLRVLITEAEADGVLGIPAEMDILSVRVKDGLCALNLSASFFEMLPEEGDQNLAGLTALVLTLCELDNIDAVRLYADGEPAPRYGQIVLPEQLDAEVIGALGGAAPA